MKLEKKSNKKSSNLVNKTTLFAVALVVLAISGVAIGLSQSNNTTNSTSVSTQYAFSQLTQDQRTQLIEGINQLRSASQQQITDNVTQTLQSFGYNVTAGSFELGHFGFEHFGFRHFGGFRQMSLN